MTRFGESSILWEKKMTQDDGERLTAPRKQASMSLPGEAVLYQLRQGRKVEYHSATKPEKTTIEIVNSPIPEDARIVAANWDPLRNELELMLESEQFQGWEPGMTLPAIDAPVFRVLVEQDAANDDSQGDPPVAT